MYTAGVSFLNMTFKAVVIPIMCFSVSSIVLLMHLLCSMHSVTIIVIHYNTLFHIIQIPGGFQPCSLQVGNQGQGAYPHDHQWPDHTRGASR